MKNWIATLLTLFGILILSSTTQAQDYNDIGRSKSEEFEILKYNGYKLSKINSRESDLETYSAKKQDKNNPYDNIICIDKNTQKVVRVIWNFNDKNFQFIKSLLSDMQPTDSTYSELENGKGKAKFTTDKQKQGYGMVVWKKKS